MSSSKRSVFKWTLPPEGAEVLFKAMLDDIRIKVNKDAALLEMIQELPRLRTENLVLQSVLANKKINFVQVLTNFLKSSPSIRSRAKSVEKAQFFLNSAMRKIDPDERIVDLTISLTLCPLPAGAIVLNNDNDNGKAGIAFLLEKSTVYKKTHDHLYSQIIATRAAANYNGKNYEAAVHDSIRAMEYGCKVDHESVAIAASSLFCLNRFEEARTLYKTCTGHLRQSDLSNEEKGSLTIDFVKWIKKSSERVLEVPPGVPRVTSEIYKEENTEVFKDLRYCIEKGRHALALKNIPAGRTILLDHPYSWIIFHASIGTSCGYCCKKSYGNIPCPFCTMSLFCSQGCLEKAQMFHQWECPMDLHLNNMNDMGRLALRTILSTDKKVLQKYAEVGKDLELDTWYFFGTTEEHIFDPSLYGSVFAQVTNLCRRDGRDVFQRAFYALYFTLLLRTIGYFQDNENPEVIPEMKNLAISDHVELTAEEFNIAILLLRHLMSAPCNAYTIDRFYAAERGFGVDEIGGATYPTVSWFNHSCQPNVYRYMSGKVCIIKALRDISQGEELFDSYVYPYSQIGLQERKTDLKSQYYFDCICTACNENWQTYNQMRATVRYMDTDTACQCGHFDIFRTKKCSKCGKKPSRVGAQQLAKSHKSFYEAKKKVLQSATDSDLMQIYMDRFNLLTQYQPLNSIYVIEAQETLKLAWNLREVQPWSKYINFNLSS